MSTTASTSNSTPRLAVIIGSIRPDRFGPTVATWLAREAEHHGSFDVDLIDLADYDLPTELGGNDFSAPLPPDVTRLGERLQQADAHLITTPIYNRGYPAGLKTAIDWFYGQWALRPVAFATYGMFTGGVTVMEQLRSVFSEFPAVTIKQFVMLPNFWERFDHDGYPAAPEGMRKAATHVLDELAWWAPMLRTARQQRPYPGLEDAVVPSGEASTLVST